MTMTTTRAMLLALALCFGSAASAQEAGTDATTTAPATEATEPAEPAAAEATPQTGRIVFFRPKKFAGGAISFKVREGEAVLGKLSNGSFFVADVPAGAHQYHARSEGKDDTLALEVEPGETYYVAGTISMGVFAGQGNLSPSDQAAFDAANAKKKLKDRTGEKVD
ncbi:DUF2846 domain-containing protein [Arenimonas sp.]|uniref:DUF2846 domain-containing protein n=1 Tax=Arenimonas sp. TaxID=1872635 RepID=UPI0035ADB922